MGVEMFLLTFRSERVSNEMVGRGGWDDVGRASASSMFWLPWPIGGICCAIATLIINAVIPDEE